MTVNLSKRTKTFDEYRKQLDDLADAIRDGEDFKWSHLTGDAGSGHACTFGILPDAWRPLTQGAAYVIYSYKTPIAWRIGCQWYAPDVKYSLTTSQHQRTIQAALGRLVFSRSDIKSHIDGVNPGDFRKGKGKSPFGPREGGW